MRPRYKVAYKMVTEMEWKCCQGYSGDDCNHGPVGEGGPQISTNRLGPGGGSLGGGGGGQQGGGRQGGGGFGGGISGSGQSGGHGGEWIFSYIC